MRLALAIALSFVFSSCKKGNYVCVCTESQNRYGTQQYDLGNSDFTEAQNQCDNYQINLNKSGTAYECRLDN